MCRASIISYLAVLNNALPALVQLRHGARQEQVKKGAKRMVEYMSHHISVLW